MNDKIPYDVSNHFSDVQRNSRKSLYNLNISLSSIYGKRNNLTSNHSQHTQLKSFCLQWIFKTDYRIFFLRHSSFVENNEEKTPNTSQVAKEKSGKKMANKTRVNYLNDWIEVKRIWKIATINEFMCVLVGAVCADNVQFHVIRIFLPCCRLENTHFENRKYSSSYFLVPKKNPSEKCEISMRMTNEINNNRHLRQKATSSNYIRHLILFRLILLVLPGQSELLTRQLWIKWILFHFYFDYS